MRTHACLLLSAIMLMLAPGGVGVASAQDNDPSVNANPGNGPNDPGRRPTTLKTTTILTPVPTVRLNKPKPTKGPNRATTNKPKNKQDRTPGFNFDGLFTDRPFNPKDDDNYVPAYSGAAVWRLHHGLLVLLTLLSVAFLT